MAKDEVIWAHVDGTWNTPADKTNIWKLHKHFGWKYFKGPGTKALLLDRLFGGAFGNGADDIATAVFEYVMAQINIGGLRPIKLSGFSRGATIVSRVNKLLCEAGYPPAVLICFDRVSAMGVPYKVWPFTVYDDYFMDSKVDERTTLAIHAMANDEYRKAYQHTEMDPADNVVQMRFPGGHGEIGSGATTFRWVLEILNKAGLS